ncbi:ORF70 [Xestia c-nigrum granulovirus]|uniref:ORF70 n=1 Tax=Xestia c-nigrum granulosis virus TaxID=51677 RepID=Q9PYX3_GVXN|nr:ORF70 [Xestia c-nigrum granulovirus]AAF05184.1 ORF70 [Xestia c-nigrum granulovirus]
MNPTYYAYGGVLRQLYQSDYYGIGRYLNNNNNYKKYPSYIASLFAATPCYYKSKVV